MFVLSMKKKPTLNQVRPMEILFWLYKYRNNNYYFEISHT